KRRVANMNGCGCSALICSMKIEHDPSCRVAHSGWRGLMILQPHAQPLQGSAAERRQNGSSRGEHDSRVTLRRRLEFHTLPSTLRLEDRGCECVEECLKKASTTGV